MALALSDVNLLELRKSEREELAAILETASQSDFENLSQKIENTLSKFSAVFPENEEQIYLFGVEMRSLLKSMKTARSIPSFRAHPEPDVTIVFGGGFLGLAFKETLSKLEEDRRRRRKDMREALAARQVRQQESEISLVKDIQEVVAETAAALVPPQIIVRR